MGGGCWVHGHGHGHGQRDGPHRWKEGPTGAVGSSVASIPSKVTVTTKSLFLP